MALRRNAAATRGALNSPEEREEFVGGMAQRGNVVPSRGAPNMPKREEFVGVMALRQNAAMPEATGKFSCVIRK